MANCPFRTHGNSMITVPIKFLGGVEQNYFEDILVLSAREKKVFSRSSNKKGSK